MATYWGRAIEYTKAERDAKDARAWARMGREDGLAGRIIHEVPNEWDAVYWPAYKAALIEAGYEDAEVD